jgi:phage minor structural protein
MDTLEKVILFDRHENFLAELNPDTFDPQEVEGIDGEHRLSFTYPLEEEDVDLIKNGCMVAIPKYGGGVDDYDLFKITKLTHDDFLLSAECDHDYYSMSKGDLVDWSTDAQLATDPIAKTLEKERYEVGIVENVRKLKREQKRVNPLESLRFIEKEWEGELRFRVTIEGNYKIRRIADFLNKRGSFVGNRFEFGHNMNEFEVTIEDTDLYTAAYGFGKAEQGEQETDPTTGEPIEKEEVPLTFENIEWKVANGDPVDKPLGQKWVGDEAAREKFGRLGKDGNVEHLFSVWDSQAETEEGLLWETWAKVQQNSQPIVNVESKVIDLASIDPDFAHETAQLGDEHYVIADIKGKPVEMITRIIKIERNRKEPTENIVELGSFLPSDSRIQIETQSRTEEKIDAVSERVTGVVEVVSGKNSNFYGEEEPTGANKGDLWFKIIDGDITETYQYDGVRWNPITNIHVQEAIKAAENAERIGEEAAKTADAATGIANAAHNNAQTAISDAETAVEQANKASSDAESAISQAFEAYTEADAAKDNAAAASTAAGAAQTAAADAVRLVDEAKTAANAAQTNAATAISNSSTALNNANKAIDDAATAISNAKAAQTDATTAIGDAATAITDAKSALKDVGDLSQSVETRFSDVDGKISRLVTQTTYDALAGTVATHTTEISQTKNALSSKADMSIVNTLKGTVSSHATAIEQNATAISSKAEASVVNAMKGTVDSHASLISQNATAITQRVTNETYESGIKGAKDYTDNLIDGIEIGGINLLSGTSDEWVLETIGTYNRPIGIRYHYADLGLRPGDKIVFGIDVDNTLNDEKELRARIDFYTNSTGEEGKTAHYGSPLIGQRVGRTYAFAIVSEERPYILLMVNNAETTSAEYMPFNYRKVQLEKGTKPTEWKPATIDYLERFVKNETSITQTANAIKSLATQSSVNTLMGTVENHTTKIEQNATAISSKAETSVVNTLKGTVSSHATAIEQNATAISSKAESSVVNALSGSVSEHQTLIEQNAKAITSRVTNESYQLGIDETKDYADGIVADLRIGARNLLERSGTELYQKQMDENSGDYMAFRQFNIDHVDEKISVGETITISFDVLMEIGTHIEVYDKNNYAGKYFGRNEWNNIGTDWVRLSYTTVVQGLTKSTSHTLDFYSSDGYGDRFAIKNIKIERGSKATDWTLAPEDYESRFESNETIITQTSETIKSLATQNSVDTLSNTVSNHSTKIEQNASNISSKASASSVDTLTGRVSTAESTISQQATQIQSKISTSDADKKYATQSSLTQSANSLTSQITSVQTNLENMEIGGRNLLSESRILEIYTNNGSEYPIVKEEITGGNYRFVRVSRHKPELNPTTLSIYTTIPQSQFVYAGMVGKKVTVSFKMRASHETRASLFVGISNPALTIADRENYFPVSTEWEIYSYTIDSFPEIEGDGVLRVSPYRVIIPNSVTQGEFYIDLREWKIEFGDKATDWMLATEDMATVTQFSSLKQTVDSISTSVTEKVDETTFNTTIEQFATAINQKISVSDADSKYTQASLFTQTINGIQTQVNGKVGTSTYNSFVSQTNNAISQRITETTADGRYATQSLLTQTATSLTSTISDVQKGLDGLEVGGANLLADTDFSIEGNVEKWERWSGNTYSGGIPEIETFETGEQKRFMRIESIRGLADGNYFGVQSKNRFSVVEGQEYVLSFLVALHPNSDQNMNYVYLMYDDASNQGISNRKDISEFKAYGKFATGYTLTVREYVIKFVARKTSDKVSILLGNGVSRDLPSTNYGLMFVSDIKVEKGNVATSWSQSPKDLATNSQITQLSDNINLRVEKDNIINAVNISDEGIQIYGNKLHITASTYIDNAVIKSAMIDTLDAAKITTGTLNADRIAGRSIDASKLKAGTITASSGVIGSIDANKITTGTISSARIASGSITADKLSATAINGKTITGADITSTSNNNSVRLVDGAIFLKYNGADMIKMENYKLHFYDSVREVIWGYDVADIGFDTYQSGGKRVRGLAINGVSHFVRIQSFGNPVTEWDFDNDETRIYAAGSTGGTGDSAKILLQPRPEYTYTSGGYNPLGPKVTIESGDRNGMFVQTGNPRTVHGQGKNGFEVHTYMGDETSSTAVTNKRLFVVERNELRNSAGDNTYGEINTDYLSLPSWTELKTRKGKQYPIIGFTVSNPPTDAGYPTEGNVVTWSTREYITLNYSGASSSGRKRVSLPYGERCWSIMLQQFDQYGDVVSVGVEDVTATSCTIVVRGTGVTSGVEGKTIGIYVQAIIGVKNQ